MWGILVALISGALMSLQGVFNTEVTKQSSIWAAAGWVQATALITCVVLYFCTGRGEIWGMFSIDRKYMLLGGVWARSSHGRSLRAWMGWDRPGPRC